MKKSHNLKYYIKIFLVFTLLIITLPLIVNYWVKRDLPSFKAPKKQPESLLGLRKPYLPSWKNKRNELKFTNDGYFKIVQFSDIQDGPDTDIRTIELMNKVLDFEEPQLVILGGDNTDGRCRTTFGLRKAISNISKPMEARQIPWAVVFGNHDDENNIPKDTILKFYLSYPHNISQRGPKDIDGVGNYHLPVKNSNGDKVIFNIYLLDSGNYAPNNVGGYAWIKPSQIEWYRKTSQELKSRYNRPIPSLMFFHIPLPEFKQLWNSGKASGQKNESVDSPKINSGLFSSLLEMGDVMGVFVGHDHTNDFLGEYCGIRLGFSRNVGYATYGKAGFARGARIFSIKESDASHFKTWMRLASDFS